MSFEHYYRELARRGGKSTPNSNDARRDYLASLRVALDGFYGR